MKQSKHFNSQNRGITLVELIVSIAIGMIVIAVVFSLLIYGINVYRWGVIQNNLQNELRLATDVIRDNVRYANWLFVPPTDDPSDPEYFDLNDPNSFVEGWTYIYLIDNSVYIKKDAENKTILDFSGTNSEFSGANITLTGAPFSVVEGVFGNCIMFLANPLPTDYDNQTLSVSFSGASAKYEKDFQLETKIKILNTNSFMGFFGQTPIDDPEDPPETDIDPPAVSTCLGDGSNVVSIAPNATVSIGFSESISYDSKVAVENAVKNAASEGKNQLVFTWSDDNTNVQIYNSDKNKVPVFVSDVLVTVQDLAGNTSGNLMIINAKD